MDDLSDIARALHRARRAGRGVNDRGSGRDTPPPADGLAGYLAGRLPDDWFTHAPEVQVDRDEITIVGVVAAPEGGAGDPDAETGRIRRFREQTREARIGIAREIEQRFGRQVAWGVVAGQSREIFTNQSVPTMTRLRQPERIVLDTLVDSGVARSRSEALGWCVRLVAANAGPWLQALQTAMEQVATTRSAGPTMTPAHSPEASASTERTASAERPEPPEPPEPTDG